MNIDWIIPCRYGEVHDNLPTIVGAGVDTYTVPTFPAAVQVMVMVRLLAAHDEIGPGISHTARNVITGPGGEVVSELENGFQMDGDAPNRDWLNPIAVTMGVQFNAVEEGTYSLEHIVDGSSRTVPFHVVRAQPAA